MSAFIGPIHYWLYEKIKLVADRENYIFNKAYELCTLRAEELREQVWQVYGVQPSEKDLSELIDHDNIHSWLARQIKIVETREAAFIKELLDACGDSLRAAIEEAFTQHGNRVGKNAKLSGKYSLNTASGIYKALYDYYLNGMPCDQSDMVVKNELDHVIWQATCLQAANWKQSGSNFDTMMGFYVSWLTAFVSAVNEEFSFRQDAAGSSINRFEIYRQS